MSKSVAKRNLKIETWVQITDLPINCHAKQTTDNQSKKQAKNSCSVCLLNVIQVGRFINYKI